MSDVVTLEVRLHDRPVGTLTRIAGERILFALDEGYVEDARRPTLSLGLKSQLGGLITDFAPTQTRLLPFFSNLLPEGHMRAYLAARAGVKPAREFALLQALGLDLAGAVTIASTDGRDRPLEDGAAVGGEAARDEPGAAPALRFSLAGLQLKLSAILRASGGLTIPARGVGGSRIVKLPSAQFAGVPENEFAMMTLARLVGIDAPPVALVELDSIANLPSGLGALAGRALAVERFDRRADGTRVHAEDFAQIFRVYPEAKYAKASCRSIAAVIAAEGELADVAELIRRLVFMTLIGNADMHLKNWSMIYPDGRRAALAPAYDMVATIVHVPDHSAALSYSRTKRFDALTEDELSHLAGKARLPERLVLDTARATVALFHEHWRAERHHLPLTRAAAATIEAHLRTLPIAAIG